MTILSLTFGSASLGTLKIAQAVYLIFLFLICTLGPSDTLNKLVVSKDKAYLNKPMFFFGFLNMGMWCVYGFVNKIYPIMLANAIGVVIVANVIISYT